MPPVTEVRKQNEASCPRKAANNQDMGRIVHVGYFTLHCNSSSALKTIHFFQILRKCLLLEQLEFYQFSPFESRLKRDTLPKDSSSSTIIYCAKGAPTYYTVHKFYSFYIYYYISFISEEFLRKYFICRFSSRP